jgi:hypothetical protein
VRAKHVGNDPAARAALNRAMEIGESKRAANKSMNHTRYTVDSVHLHSMGVQSQASPRR